MRYFEAFIALFFLVLLSYFFHNKNKLPTHWPLVGMIPAFLQNVHRINDFVVDLVEISQSTFLLKGPWFTNMDLLFTVEPANVNHVMSKRFGTYHRGSKFHEIFDILGDGIFNAESDLWQYHRRMAQSFIGNGEFHRFLVKQTWEKVDRELIPILEHVSKEGLEVDLQDLFENLIFDTNCVIFMSHDPKTLSTEFSSNPLSKAISDAEEAILYRHVVPTCIWKFQRWLDIGQERKHRIAWQTIDAFIYKCIDVKREEMSKVTSNAKEESTDLLTLYMDETEEGIGKNNDKFLRDTLLNFIIAARDTTSSTLSWFFYLLSKNPHVVSKVREELEGIKIQGKEEDLNYHGKYKLSRNFEELSDKLVYLHCALCETLRLYPPVVFNPRVPIEPDILPSGHRVNPNMQIIFSLYAMARMKSIWGDDCYEFKPERWISDTGEIRREPSYKFLAFGAGPRSCLGKNMAFTQMKIVAATVIQNYHIQAVEGHHVVPDASVILHMKHGFKAKVIAC